MSGNTSTLLRSNSAAPAAFDPALAGATSHVANMRTYRRRASRRAPRRRLRRAPRRRAVRRRRVGRYAVRSRIRRAVSTTIQARFLCDNVYGAIISSPNNGVNFQLFPEIVAAYTSESNGTFNAIAYYFKPRISQLLDSGTGDRTYPLISALYDQLRVRSIDMVFRPPSGLRNAITAPQGNSSNYTTSLTGLPDSCPDCTWIDVDNDYNVGVQANLNPQRDITLTGMSRYGARMHRFGSTIRRRLRPVVQIPVLDNTGTVTGVSNASRMTIRGTGYFNSTNPDAFWGGVILAFAYRGTNATSGGQLQYGYACQTVFNLALRCPLYG